MQILSQRDPRWANIKLGTSNNTIGTHGCTITCIAMIIGTTPDVVNERLKALPKDAQGNTGFASGNLVYWSKIEEAFKGIKVRRVWSYNNDDVKANLPAIIQVDGSPIGAPMHFVVYVGNQKLYDPWTGTERPTSTYTAQSYAILSGKWEQDTFPVEKKVFEELVGKATERDEYRKVGTLEEFKKLKAHQCPPQRSYAQEKQQIIEIVNKIG